MTEAKGLVFCYEGPCEQLHLRQNAKCFPMLTEALITINCGWEAVAGCVCIATPCFFWQLFFSLMEELFNHAI